MYVPIHSLEAGLPGVRITVSVQPRLTHRNTHYMSPTYRLNAHKNFTTNTLQ